MAACLKGERLEALFVGTRHEHDLPRFMVITSRRLIAFDRWYGDDGWRARSVVYSDIVEVEISMGSANPNYSYQGGKGATVSFVSGRIQEGRSQVVSVPLANATEARDAHDRILGHMLSASTQGKSWLRV